MTARPNMKKSVQKITPLTAVPLLTGAVTGRHTGESMH